MSQPDLTAYPALRRIIETRHSTRSFDIDRPVDPALIAAVIDAARLAPSAVNRQPWHFVVIRRDDPARQAILDAYPRPWINTAPDIIVCCEDHSSAWHRGADDKDHADIDIAIATEHICLAAQALGLGTCWVCNFDPAPVARAIALPEGWEAAVLIPIGYHSATAPDGEHRPETARRPLEEIMSWGKF